MNLISFRSQLITEIVDVVALKPMVRESRALACYAIADSDFFKELFLKTTGVSLLEGYRLVSIDMNDFKFNNLFQVEKIIRTKKNRWIKTLEKMESISSTEEVLKRIKILRNDDLNISITTNLSITGKNTAYYEKEEDYSYTPNYTIAEVSSEIDPYFDRPHEHYTDYFISVND